MNSRIQDRETTEELNLKWGVEKYSAMNRFNPKARSPKQKNFSPGVMQYVWKQPKLARSETLKFDFREP